MNQLARPTRLLPLLLAATLAWAFAMPPLGARAQEALPGEVPSPESATDESPTEDPEESEISEEIEAEPLESDALTKGIEEIRVIGITEGFSELQEMPTSAVGFDPTELQREHINDIRDLSSYTPNLEIKTAFAASNPVLFIRGVGLDDFNANSGSAVAVYQDGIYMNSPAGQLFQFFDSAGVEVLRGPQGGRYRNATAGAILVKSQEPTDELEIYGTFTYGNYDKQQFEGAIGGPLPGGVGDYVSGRLALTGHFMDGLTENRCGGQKLVPHATQWSSGCMAIQFPDYNLGAPQDIEDPVNDVSMWAGRGMLRFTIPAGGSDAELLLNAHGGRSDGLAAQYQHRGFQTPPCPFPCDPTVVREKIPGNDGDGYRDTDGDPFAGDYNITGDELLDVWGVSLRGSWAPTDLIEITSITGYEWHDRFVLENTDANPSNFLALEYNDTAWQLSQELEVASYWTDSLETHAGVYFITEDLDAFNVFDTPSQIDFDQDFWQTTYGFAAFGSAEWDFLPDRFTLGGSIRYNWEYKEFGVFSRAFFRAGPGAIGEGISLSGTESDVFTGVAGGVSLTYHFPETIDHIVAGNVYQKYSRGWKPGHFNGGAIYSGQLIEPVRPEIVDSYEVGLRSSWFGALLQLDLTAFYYDYRDLQVFQLEQDTRGFPIFQLVNAEEAEVYGVELDLHASPIEGLDLRYHMSFLESEYGKFGQSIFVPGPRPGPGQPREIKEINIDYSGNRLIGSPVWSLGGAVEYAFPVGRFGELIPRFSFSWKDKVFFDPAEGKGAQQDLPDDTIAQGAYWQFHAGLMYRSPEQRFEFTGWVRNLTDEQYKVTSFDVTGAPFQFVLDVYGQPRTYGFTVSVYF